MDDLAQNFQGTFKDFKSKELVLLQGILSLACLLRYPLYQVKNHFYLTVLDNNKGSITPDEFLFLSKSIDEKCLKPDNVIFRNGLLMVGFTLVVFFSFPSKRLKKARKKPDTQITNVFFGLFIWFLLCQFILVPARTVLLQRMKGIFDIFRNPISSILSICLFILSLPFSLKNLPLVEDMPLETLLKQVRKSKDLTDFTCSSLYDFYYSWSVIPILLIFVIDCILLNYLYAPSNTDEEMLPEEVVEARKISEVTAAVQSVSVKKLSSQFEGHQNHQTQQNVTPSDTKRNLSRGKQTITTRIHQNKDSPKQPVELTEQQQPVIKVLAKVRPLNIITASNTNQNQQHSGITVSQVTSNNINESDSEMIVSQSGDRRSDNKRLNTVKSVMQKTFKDSSTQCLDLKKPKLYPPIRLNVGLQMRPLTQNMSQQTVNLVNVQEAGISVGLQSTPDVRNTPQQTEQSLKVDQEVMCEILSQEQFTKLQQSALLLYKRSVEKYHSNEAKKMDKRKLAHSQRRALTCDKSVQVSIGPSPPSEINLQEKIIVREISKSNVSQTGYCESNTQTELYGYVLEKIVQDRETNIFYNKPNLEKTVHSTVALSDQYKQHTEPIRFKAMKSQHGVWYVSLRGDIFLTVSQDVLMNIKINEIRKIETEIPNDILRTMKIFVDNYNKLSGCFDDDENESDDESFINGFRL